MLIRKLVFYEKVMEMENYLWKNKVLKEVEKGLYDVVDDVWCVIWEDCWEFFVWWYWFEMIWIWVIVFVGCVVVFVFDYIVGVGY